jgi:transcriptional regulator NrdR family protein
MSVTDTRRPARNPQLVRRKRVCAGCGTSFQTEERPRLWIKRGEEQEPFFEDELLASLRRAAAGCDPRASEDELRNVVRSVLAGILADGESAPSVSEVRERTGRALLDQDLQRVAYRYDAALLPDPFDVVKQSGRPREPFDRSKLKASIEHAAVGFLDADHVEELVREIENHLGGGSGAIESTTLRRLVSDGLRHRDERAFLRYALGGHSGDESLDEFLNRIAPTPRVLKRDGSVVLFEGSKLAKSIHRSFIATERNARRGDIAKFVAAEERRIRAKLRTDREPESTVSIGQRVLDWLFDIDERAWANYWIAFASDHELIGDGGPAQELAKAHLEKRIERASRPA